MTLRRIFLVFALLAAACGGDDPADEDTSSVEAVTTTVAPAEGAGGDGTAGDGVAAGDGTSTTAPGGQPGAPAAGTPGTAGTADARNATTGPSAAPAPPKAGNYPYRLTTNGPNGRSERETTTVVTDVGRNGGEVLQRIKLETEQGTLDNDIVWRSDSVVVLKTVIEAGGQRIDCDWNPDLVQAALPMAVGKTWKSDSSCATTAFGQQMTIKSTGSASVVRTERVKVGGQDVDAWVIESTARNEVKSQAVNQVVDTKSTTWFAPAIGMVVREVATSRTSGGPGQAPQERTSEMVLLSTAPR